MENLRGQGAEPRVEFAGGDLVVNSLADDDRDAGAPDFGPTGEELAAFHAQRVAPRAVHPDGDDGGDEFVLAFALNDTLEAALEGPQLAGPGDLPFGEDGDDFAGFEFLARPGQGGKGFAW